MINKVLELDFAYLETFANRIDTAWGCIFYNEEQPNYYNANHAHVNFTPNDPQAVIEETVSFYKKRNLVPRFYLYDFDRHQQLVHELKVRGWGIEVFDDPIQLWDHKLKVVAEDKRIAIEVVTDANFTEALEIECSIKEFGGREVREGAFTHEFHHPAYTYYLLRFNGKACATACIFIDGSQGRLESVATLEEFRGQGLIGRLIHHIQHEATKSELENIWVFPINERVEKVYQKNGFTTIGTVKTGHAFLGGKSISEIYEG